MATIIEWAEKMPTPEQWAELVRNKGEFDGWDDDNLILISHNDGNGYTIAPDGRTVGTAG